MVKKIFKKIPPVAIPLIACVVMLCVLAVIISYRVNASSAGSLIGEKTGSAVGMAIGSLEGLTVGQREGYEAGKEEGLSAKDTTAELSGAIKDVAKLQVLVASGTYTDKIEIGKEYAAIFSQDYNTIFTVNLETASIELRGDRLHLVLDQPKAEFLPKGKYRILSEWEAPTFIVEAGDAHKGHIAIVNSINVLIKEGNKMFNEDEAMMDSARACAEDQLKKLVRAVSLTKPEVFIEWRAE